MHFFPGSGCSLQITKLLITFIGILLLTMYRLLLIYFLLLVGSCSLEQSPQEKLEHRVRRYLGGSLNDTRSYIPLQFEIAGRFAPNGAAATMRRQQMKGFVFACSVEKQIAGDTPEPVDTALIQCCWKVKHRFVYKNNSGDLRDSMLTFYIDTAYQIQKIE
jgi:hypothetical protein